MAVFVVATSAFVEVGGVGVAAAGHGDVEQCAAGVFAEHGVAGVGGDTLSGVHGHRVAEADVLAEVVVVEDDAGPVVETLGSKAIRLGVDRGDAPAVAVAHRRQRLGIGAGLVEVEGGVVAAADDQVPDRDALTPGSGHGGRVGGRSVAMDPRVERVGHFGGVAHQQRVLPAAVSAW